MNVRPIVLLGALSTVGCVSEGPEPPPGEPWDPLSADAIFVTSPAADDLRIARFSNGEVTELTDGDAPDNVPRPSPDGEWVAYQSQRDSTYDVWVMRIDGSEARNLTPWPSHEGLPVWSPDSERIAFFSSRDLEYPESGPVPGHIWIVRRDGSGNGGARYAPDGETIAVYSESELRADIVLMRADGSERRVLTDASNEGNFYLHDWSPDGEWISITWLPADFSRREVWAMRAADGTTVTLLDRMPAREWSWTGR